MLKARLASVGKSQRVVFLMARIKHDDLAVLHDLLEAGSVVPTIDRHFELSDVPDALSYVGEGHARGKVVITV